MVLTLVANERSGSVLGRSEVLEGRARGTASTKKKGVGSLRVLKGELIEGQAASSGLENSGTRSLGESQGADAHLRDIHKAHIVSDSSDDDGDLSLLTLKVSRNTRHGHGRAVVLAHVQTLKHDLVKLGVRTTREESVELDQEVQVHVLRLGRGTSLGADTASSGNDIFSL